MFFTAGLLRDFALMMGTVNVYEKNMVDSSSLIAVSPCLCVVD